LRARIATGAFAAPGELLGQTVVLEPLDRGHRDGLRDAAELDQSIWTFFPKGFNGAGDDFDDWFEATLEHLARNEHYPFAVRRRDNRRIIGTTRFYDMAPIHRRLALGSTWYTPEARGTHVNYEVRLLTLSYAFEDLGVNRVELITDPRNLSSQAAMKLLGVVQEGVIRSHLIYKDGRVRDSLLFSIVKAEWPEVKQRLLSRLSS
jgi:RimJ/RimL family protein N-acetyltransferase